MWRRFPHAASVCAIPRIEMQEEDGVTTIRIQLRKGSYEGMPAQRDYSVSLMTRMNAEQARVNGRCVQVLQGTVSVPVRETGEEIVITVRSNDKDLPGRGLCAPEMRRGGNGRICLTGRQE